MVHIDDFVYNIRHWPGSKEVLGYDLYIGENAMRNTIKVKPEEYEPMLKNSLNGQTLYIRIHKVA